MARFALRFALLLLAAFGVAAAGAWGWPSFEPPPPPPPAPPAPPLTRSDCANKYKGSDDDTLLALYKCREAAAAFEREETIKRDEILGVRCDSMVKTERVAARDVARCRDHCVEHLRSSKLEEWVCPEAPPAAPSIAPVVGQKAIKEEDFFFVASFLVLLVLTLLAQTGTVEPNMALALAASVASVGMYKIMK